MVGDAGGFRRARRLRGETRHQLRMAQNRRWPDRFHELRRIADDFADLARHPLETSVVSVAPREYAQRLAAGDAWLTAAIDPRVIGVAPMVIDVLNMQAQMEYQRATWGDVSAEIRDYSDLNLPARLRSDQGRELISIVDPYTY